MISNEIKMRIKDDTIKKISSTIEKLLSGAYVATSMGMTQFSKLKFNFSQEHASGSAGSAI